MKEGGLTERLVAFSDAFLRRIRGRIGALAVVASLFFGAITGSSMACVAAIGFIIIPQMMMTSYDKKAEAAVCSALRFLGVLIPPSIPTIFLSMVTGLSISAPFLAAASPGVLLALGYIVINYCKFNRSHLNSGTCNERLGNLSRPGNAIWIDKERCLSRK